MLLGAGLLSLSAWGAQPSAEQTASPQVQVKEAAPSDFVGAETCATCHEAEASKFATNPHSKMAAEHGKAGVTCEGCHGAGREHVEGGGDKTKIFNPATAKPKDVDKKCLECHAGQHANFDRSTHGKANVSCIDCHTIHAGEAKDHLLKATQPTLCYQCHSDVKPQFSMPFHHRVNEGLMNCSDCHDPHGTLQSKMLRNTAEQNAVCTKCHTETAGPFLYEHPVVKTEGCTACHSPHGSQNPRLLKVSNINTLCLQCHSTTNTAAFPNAAYPIGPAHNQAAQYAACTTCHTQIHGSNASSVLFK